MTIFAAKMKILWLDINASYAHSSLAIPSLDAQLSIANREAHHWKVISGTINSKREDLLKEVYSFSPDLILSTLWLFNHDFSLSLLSRVAALLPQAKIVLGGPEFLGDNHSFLACNKYITSVFRGDGEDIFDQFITRYTNGESWLSLPGFCHYTKDGEYVDNGIGYTAEFAKLNFPEESDLFDWSKPFVQLESSRGCFNRCAFCVSGNGSAIQNISMDKVRERLETFVKKGIKEVRLLDRTFNSSVSRCREFIKLFHQFSDHLKFHLEIHPALLNEEIINLLEGLPYNCVHIEAGVQSLSQEVIDICHRRGGVSESIDGIKKLVSMNKFEIHADLIAGLPGYSYSNLLKDVVTLSGLRVHEIQLELLKLLPGTFFRENAKKLDLRFSPDPPYEILDTGSTSYNELVNIMQLSSALDAWYNGIWRDVIQKMFDAYSDAPEKIISYLNANEINLKSLSKESKGLILFDFISLHYPSLILFMAINWIIEGLSLKKGPGLLAESWNTSKKDINNPLFDSSNPHLKYYYIDNDKNNTYWFAFDKRINRTKPVSIMI